ncbi:MAG: AMP-binding protein [Actinobacteria bacterium]|nr:AMP-binding protein [Actinomycetota bacterium]
MDGPPFAESLANEAPLQTLRRSLEERPDRPLIAFEGVTWNVAELATRSAQVARALIGLEIGPGSRVALMMRNRPEFFAVQYGVWMAGAVEVSVNPDLRGPSLAHVVSDSGPAVIVADRDSLAAIAEAFPTSPPESTLIAVEDDGIWGPPLAEKDWAEPGPSDLGSILYTSGTTGPSKGVMLPHAYFVNHATIHVDSQEFTAADVLYSPLAFCHIDQHIYLPICLMTGARLASRPRFSTSNFWSDIERFGATWFAGVGWILAAVAAGAPPTPGRYASLRRALAAPLTAEIYEFFEDRLGIPLGSMFGQTEADGVTFATPRASPRGSAGKAHPAFELRIGGPHGEALSSGRIGEIQYRPRGPNLVAAGYWGRPEATVDAWRDLWFHTGDHGRLDEDGFLWFTGRMTDSLRRRGENISAFELEASVKSIAGIRDCAALAIPDEAGGEDEIKLVIVLEEGTSFDPAKFVDDCTRLLPRFARPRYAETVRADELVRGPGTGAIQKRLLSTAIDAPHVVDLMAPGGVAPAGDG